MCVKQRKNVKEKIALDSTTSRDRESGGWNSSLCAHKQRHLENTIRFGRFSAVKNLCTIFLFWQQSIWDFTNTHNTQHTHTQAQHTTLTSYERKLIELIAEELCQASIQLRNWGINGLSAGVLYGKHRLLTLSLFKECILHSLNGFFSDLLYIFELSES